MRQWWITQAGRQPIGPVAEDVVIRGIKAGRVPSDSLVCEVGGDRWRSLEEVSQFGSLLTPSRPVQRLDVAARAAVEPATIAEMEPVFWDDPSAPRTEPEADARTETSLTPPTNPGDDSFVPENEETVVDRGTPSPSGTG